MPQRAAGTSQGKPLTARVVAATPTRACASAATVPERTRAMIEIGVFHNGASDLKAVTTPDGVVVNDGTLAEVSASNQRVLVSQVRQGILADQLGFDYWFMTEHP